MNANNSLEHDKSSFSKILLSKEVADIIKQVVRESTPTIRPKCNDREKQKIWKVMPCQTPNYNAVQIVGVNKKNLTDIHMMIHFVPSHLIQIMSYYE